MLKKNDPEVQRDFVHRLAMEIEREVLELDAKARRLLLAHAAFESGFGTAAPALKANNLWNTTAGPTGSRVLASWLAQGGHVWQQENADWEYSPPGVVPVGREWQLDPETKRWRKRIPQNWRAFDTWAACVRDIWVRWMGRADYRCVKAALEVADPVAYSARLYAARFFTAPLPWYTAGLVKTLGTVTDRLLEPPMCNPQQENTHG